MDVHGMLGVGPSLQSTVAGYGYLRAPLDYEWSLPLPKKSYWFDVTEAIAYSVIYWDLYMNCELATWGPPKR